MAGRTRREVAVLKDALKRVLPAPLLARLRRLRRRRGAARRQRLPQLTEGTFRTLLVDDLGLTAGDVVMVHASTTGLGPALNAHRMLGLLEEIVGPEGTLLFPTYPKVTAQTFLQTGEVFDVRTSLSYAGMLSELARRNARAHRSLHPTKSVCAIGRHAEQLTDSHHLSPLPYGEHSPYFKLVALGGKAIGLGVTSAYLAFNHCIDDALGAEFPFRPYDERLFTAKCIDSEGVAVDVETYAHDIPPRTMKAMIRRVPRLIAKHIPPTVARDVTLLDRPFFIVRTEPYFEHMKELARSGITIYPKSFHK